MRLMYVVQESECLCVTNIYDAYYDSDIFGLGRYSGLVFTTDGDALILLKTDEITGANLLRELYLNDRLDISNEKILYDVEEDDLSELEEYFC